MYRWVILQIAEQSVELLVTWHMYVGMVMLWQHITTKTQTKVIMKQMHILLMNGCTVKQIHIP